MGLRGPAPKPIPVRLAEGNKGHQKIAKHSPKFKPITPSCPEWIDERAKEEWARLAGELGNLNLLTSGDRSAFACYCQAVSDLQAAREAIDEYGRTFVTSKGFLMARPEVGMADRAMKAIKDFSVQFGFTPSARSRIDLKPSTDDGAEDLD